MLRCSFSEGSLWGSDFWIYIYREVKGVRRGIGNTWAVMHLGHRSPASPSPNSWYGPSELAHLKARRKGLHTLPLTSHCIQTTNKRQFSSGEGDFRVFTKTAAGRMNASLEGEIWCIQQHLLHNSNSEAWFYCPVALRREGDCSKNIGRELRDHMKSSSK